MKVEQFQMIKLTANRGKRIKDIKGDEYGYEVWLGKDRKKEEFLEVDDFIKEPTP